MTVVIDTNVILTANRQHADVSEECIASCARRLREIEASGRVAIDDEYRILKEYMNKTTPHLGKRPGDAFVKWLLRNNANQERCDQVRLREHQTRGYESFPDADRLEKFDPADRKFVAVVRAHADLPPILQATDSKWIDWASALKEHGVSVEFLCARDIRTFDDRKKGRKGKVR